jgi:hypothetical protein
MAMGKGRANKNQVVKMMRTGIVEIESLKPEPIQSALDPALKCWLDRVIIPALLREFTKTSLANVEDVEAQSSQPTPQEELE